MRVTEPTLKDGATKTLHQMERHCNNLLPDKDKQLEVQVAPKHSLDPPPDTELEVLRHQEPHQLQQQDPRITLKLNSLNNSERSSQAEAQED